jgi:hypothetical protein
MPLMSKRNKPFIIDENSGEGLKPYLPFGVRHESLASSALAADIVLRLGFWETEALFFLGLKRGRILQQVPCQLRPPGNGLFRPGLDHAVG